MYVNRRGAIPISSHTATPTSTLYESWSIVKSEQMLPAIRMRDKVKGYRQILLPTLHPVRLQMKRAATRMNGKIISCKMAMPFWYVTVPMAQGIRNCTDRSAKMARIEKELSCSAIREEEGWILFIFVSIFAIGEFPLMVEL